jgi:hypothetical protein
MGLKEDFQDLAPSKCLMGGIILAGLYFAVMFDNGKDKVTQAEATRAEILQTKARLGAVEKCSRR